MGHPVPSLDRLVADAKVSGRPYLEFVRTPSMSVGVYVLPVGGLDLQSPHQEEEVYHVVRGRAKFRDGGGERPVRPGDVLVVPAQTAHRFEAIEEELVLLVVFAPPESGTTEPTTLPG